MKCTSQGTRVLTIHLFKQEHLGPAVLHELEKFPVHSLSLPSLLSDMGSRSPEEALINIFRESRRTTPAVLYMPQIDLWWDTVCLGLEDDMLSSILMKTFV